MTSRFTLVLVCLFTLSFFNCFSQNADSQAPVKNDFLMLSFQAGVDYSTLKADHSNVSIPDYDFGGAVTPKFGVGIELKVPVLKKSVSAIIEPAFQMYKADEDENSEQWSAYHRSIDLALGLRYNLAINNRLSAYADVAYVVDFTSLSELKKSGRRVAFQENSTNNFAVGTGMKFRNKYTATVRYTLSRDILDSDPDWDSDYKVMSLIVGIRLT